MTRPGSSTSVPAPHPAWSSARQAIAAGRPLVIAHRGASCEAPENTLPAFELALASGADLVELDYRHAADGVPVTIHDAALDRTTDAVARWGGTDLAVAAFTTPQLATLDAGGWFDPRFRGTPLPTLAQALSAIAAGALPLVERKAGDAAACVALLDRLGLLEHVVVQAFDWQFLAACRRLAPRLVLGALGEDELSPRRLDDALACGAQLVVWDHARLGPEPTAAARARGLSLWAYTVDEPARARTLVSLGVSGLITNRPAAIRAGLAVC